MPVERSSTRSTTSTDKVHRKVKVAIRESKGWSDGVRTLELKKKGSKKEQSRGNDNGDVSYVNVYEKSSKTSGRGKRDMKLKSGNEGLETVIGGNSGQKRKRIYVDVVDRTYEDNVKNHNGRFMFKVEKGVVRSFSDKEKKMSRGKGREFENSSLTGRRTFKGSELGGQKNLRGKIKSADTVNDAQKNGTLKTVDRRKPPLATKTYENHTKHTVDSVEKPHKKRVQGKKSLATGVVRSFSDKEEKVPRGKGREFEKSSLTGRRTFKESELGDQKNLRGKIRRADAVNDAQKNGTLKTRDRRKDPLAPKTYENQTKHTVDYVEKPHNKRVQGKKSLATYSELTEDLPKKKKKRVIRIDPNDISNKRLNDDTPNSGNSKEQKDLAENIDVEMSKNAKFRAIRPSSSILSFVEDNLLGRRRDIEFRRAGYNTELSAPLDNIPFSTSSERERIEVPVFQNKLEFFAAAKISSSFPSPDLPEIAFAGRSNVGKSSLLNSLTRQWGVVRTSDKPGLTQTINFFKLGPKLSLVDLPGYGFAYAKDEVKEAWEELVKEYVTSRVGLKRVCLLIDTKWGMKPRDHELIDLMERSQTKFQIVLTKTDLVFPITVARRAMEIEESLKAKKSAIQPLMMVSSRTGAGIRCLRTALAKIARFIKP